MREIWKWMNDWTRKQNEKWKSERKNEIEWKIEQAYKMRNEKNERENWQWIRE